MMRGAVSPFFFRRTSWCGIVSDAFRTAFTGRQTTRGYPAENLLEDLVEEETEEDEGSEEEDSKS